ncbi:MAG: HD domain-containing protein [Lachnospiraceae bacterium]|nr:HD domain-containing protein [Lachnospiraceae bacterium]
MKKYSHQTNRDTVFCAIIVVLGILVNVLLSYIMYQVDRPIYLDTIGTVFVAALAGSFPGIFTAVLTNIVCALYNSESIYFCAVNAMVALLTVWFIEKKNTKSIKHIAMFILLAGLFSGGISAIIQWRLLGQPQDALMADSATAFSAATGFPFLISFWIANIVMNLLDKGICIGIALMLFHFVPWKFRTRMRNCGWRQQPLSGKELEELNVKGWSALHSLRTRITIVLLGMMFVLVIMMGWVGIRLYFDNEVDGKTIAARNAAKFAASVIDTDKIDEYIEKGDAAPGYKETEEMLYRIRENASGVKYLYILKVEEQGSTFIFDLEEKSEYKEDEEEGVTAFQPGDFVPIEEAFEPYLEQLLNGEEIPPIESMDNWSWIITTYYPVLDDKGNCVCYAGADASIDYLANYMREFLLHVFLIMLGIFILLISFGMRTTRIYLIYPIHSIVLKMERFILAGSEQKKLDAAVKDLRRLNIRTGDELEKLYDAICDMALNQTEQMRSIRRFSDATVKMQDGLIITMADLVENRDSDTGAHIQKTAAYVKIIVKGLKKKGYYAEKITPKFISDVVRSAPLHDIGKIQISDTILNKPGKLTEEEYEIMKSHTTAGKHIMEKAINTVEGANYLKEARNMAAYHHERWDGKGYPEGLHGEVIPLSARIMAVADVFDALTSPRVYKKSIPLEKALEMIQEGAGSQFDPKCVEVFMDSLPKVKVILKKYNETL